MAEREEYTTCRDCRCRDHSILTLNAERLSTWQMAREALQSATWATSDDWHGVDPTDVLILARWLEGEDISS